jgi:hypothetical protein
MWIGIVLIPVQILIWIGIITEIWIRLVFKMMPIHSQCCGSGMVIPNPGSKNSIKERGGKIVVLPFFCSHKIENYFIFELVKKTIFVSLQRIVELFTQKSH